MNFLSVSLGATGDIEITHFILNHQMHDYINSSALWNFVALSYHYNYADG